MGKLIHMPKRQYQMPRRPERFTTGPDLSPGTHELVVVGDAFTICRTVDASRWYPLTQRENPAWLTWPTLAAAAAQLDGIQPAICNHPYWGQ